MHGFLSIRFSQMHSIRRLNVSRGSGEAGGTPLTDADLGLQVLDNVIMTRWKVLPRDQCHGKLKKLYALASS